ncbi:MAG: MBL fold metallo-hydrolase, partial [Oscillospiraceae bacterium]|nr:MBL fold metallo-hydrolase [Oscillospiraceae bacterium]
GLTDWISGFGEKPKLVFVNHGENEVTDSFAAYLEENFGFKAFAPYSGTEFDLISGRFLACPAPVLVKKETTGGERGSALYNQLLDDGEALLTLIRSSRERPNKTLKQFIRDLEALQKKYQ